LAGCGGVNLHGGNRGSYTPIADRNGTVVEVRPLFYGMVMFAHGAEGLALQSAVNADAAIDISAWGVQRNDGGLNAFLSNKDAQRSVMVKLNTGIAANRFQLLWLRGAGLQATSGQSLGGAIIGADGSWAPEEVPPITARGGQLDILLPPAAAVLVRSL
jgi:hypothetical protein